MQWLPLAKWWYNTSYHTATKMTPYEAVYGQQPPTITTYLPGTSKVQSIDTMLQGRTTTLAALKDNLLMAQNRMKQQEDQHRSERVFQEGDQVFLRLQTYKQTSLKNQGHRELEPKFYGPFIKCIGWPTSPSNYFQNPFGVPCFLFEESGGTKLQSPNHPSRIR
jgi:hypothetical protein